ncbi:DMT family transporter [Streptomyces cyanogenus]|uniref:Amino-acid metabolite efflux pump n=1 Tax=Streptomyces cyanogenus TaxID=80860 RepID=A0ABX7TWX9_STRCY|nr:DMT family transporter [Streptomyces cyanogenus]QTD99720.1 putative amino-acid metabolite efflux pump [Streptomyces cyanogenus]
MKLNRTLCALAVTVGLWATAFPAIRVALDGYTPAQLSLLRLAVASAALAAVLPWVKVRPPAARDLPLVLLVGATGMSAYQLLLNWGELHVPAGTAALIVAVVPAVSALLAAAFLGERLGPAGVLGSLVALAGTVLIATTAGETRYTVAAWTVLAAAVAQAVYHFAIKPLLRRYSGLEVATHAMWAGTALLLPLGPATAHAVADAPAGATLAALYLGVLPSAAGFVIWGYAVARLTVTAATAALYLVPVTALVVAYVWLGERPGPVQLLGGLVTLAGVALVNRRPGGPAPSSDRPAGAVSEGAGNTAPKQGTAGSPRG